VGVIAKGLLCAHGGGPRRMGCLLLSYLGVPSSAKRRARHVTRSFRHGRLCCNSLAFLIGRFKEPPSALDSPSHVRNFNISMMSLAVHPLRVGPPPVASSPRTRTLHLRSRSTTCSRSHAVHIVPDHSQYITSSLIPPRRSFSAPRRAISYKHLSTIRDPRRWS
jgi:hypothetical protein